MKQNSVIILAIPSAQCLTFIPKLHQDKWKQVVGVEDGIIRPRNQHACDDS